MKRYGLIGRTLGHSFSAAYFADKFVREGIDAEYNNFQLPDIRELRALIADSPDLCGLNVTIPYKQTVLPLLDELDDVASAIGAVNTIIISRTDNAIHLRGSNTDAPGFLAAIIDMLPSDRQIKALLLGTGGASQAVKYALQSIGVECTFVSRTLSPGRLTYDNLDREVISAHRLIVNCTPLGTYPNSEDFPAIPYGLITPDHLACDLVYNPGCTEFMRRCAEQGAAVRNGLKMLYAQADLSWKLWTDQLSL